MIDPSADFAGQLADMRRRIAELERHASRMPSTLTLSGALAAANLFASADNLGPSLTWHANVSSGGFRVARLGALWFAMGYIGVSSGITGSDDLVTGIPSDRRPSIDSTAIYFPDNTAVAPFRLGGWSDGTIEVRSGTSLGNGYFLAFGF